MSKIRRMISPTLSRPHANDRWLLSVVILPLLLTILPLWLLQREAERESRRAVVEADDLWFSRTETAARRMSDASHPRFWVERGLRRVRSGLERRLKAGAPIESPEAVAYADQGWKFWGCTFPNGAIEGRAQSLVIPGFATAGRALMTQTLQEIARAQISSGERLGQEPLSSRLRTQFGLSISGIYFQPSQRGQSFASLMDEKIGFAVWDLLRHRGKIAGIIVAFLPTMDNAIRSGPNRILEAWKSRDLQPVFFQLPTGEPLPMPLTTSEVKRDPDGRRLLARIRRTLHIRPGPMPNGDLIGRTWLPLTLLNRPLRLGNWRFRLMSLDPVCGYLGMLCQRVKPPTPGILARTRDVVGGLCFLGWLIAALVIWRTGSLPSPGVHLGLFLWFAGVVAVPLLLGFSSANAMLIDREKTLIDGLQREIEATLSAIDRESVRLTDAQGQACRRLLDRPDRIGELRRCQLERRSPEPVLRKIAEEAQTHDLDLRMILLFGFNGYSKHFVTSGWSPQTDQLTLDMLDRIYGRKIVSEPPPMPLSAFPPPDRISRAGSIFSSDLSVGLQSGASFDRVEETALGGIMFSTFHTRLRLDGATWFVAVLGWTQKLAHPKYLTNRLAREAVRAGSPKLVALRYDPDPALTIPASAPVDLIRFARQARRGRVLQRAFLGRERHLYVGAPSVRMPGFVLAARMSLVQIEREIADERRTLRMLIGSGFTLVLLLAWLLSQWLAGPIVRISKGLTQIADGDLDVTVAEARQDELGQAGNSLDAMTRSLRERRQLSRFVPPQVLEIAAAGDPNLAVSGRKQVVTILSSDMRSFTTLSERHPPVQIFQMLNRHLDAMTRAIQREGGVIDRFIGDAVVAVFPAVPGEKASHTARAVRAARAMMHAHAALIAERASHGEFPYAIGIGLESGEVVTGVLGDPEVQLDFSVLGEAVARAGDLEALSKNGRAARIIASDVVRKSAGRECVWLPLSGHPKVFELEIPGFQFPDVMGGEGVREMPELPGRSDPGVAEELDVEVVSTSPDVAPSSPKQVTVSHAGASRPSLAFMALGMLIWLLPFAMVRQSWNDFERSHQDAARTRTMLRLQDDLRFVEQSLEPSMMASLDLRHRMDVAGKRTLRRVRREMKKGASRDERGRLFRYLLPDEIRKVLEPLRRRFPSLFWCHDSSVPPPPVARARFDCLDPARSGFTFSRIGNSEPAACRTFGGGRMIDLQAGGFDIWWNDDLAYAWRPMNGDGTCTVRLVDMISMNRYAKAGLMLRETIASSSRYVSLYYMPLGGPCLGYRPDAACSPIWINGEGTLTPPFWMRLARQGDHVTGSIATDGVSWKTLGSCRFPASSSLSIGPVLCGRVKELTEPGLPQVITRGGPVPPTISDEDIYYSGSNWRWSLFWRLTGSIDSMPKQTTWSVNRRLFPDAQNIEFVVGNLARQLFPTTFEGRTRQVYIHPFFGTDLTRRSLSLKETIQDGIRRNSANDRFGVVREFWENLYGMLWLFMEPAELTLPRTLPLMVREMQRRGVELSIAENPGPPRPYVSLPITDGRLRLAGTAFSGSRPLLITIGRKLDDASSAHAFAGFGHAGWILGSLWILAGLAIGGRWLSSGELPAPTLRRRLLIAFLAASLPFMLCSWLLLERAVEEARIRVSLDARDSCLHDLRRVDSSRTLLDGALLALADARLVHSDLPQILASELSGITPGNLIAEDGLTLRETGLKQFYFALTSCGFRSGGVNLLDAKTMDRYPPPQLRSQAPGSANTRVTAVGKFFSYLFKYTYGRMVKGLAFGPSGDPRRISAEETMIGAEFEGFSQGLAMMLGLSRMADLTLSSKSIGSWSLTSDGRECILRHTIWHHTKPVGDLQFNWASGYTEPRQLAPLFDRFPDLVPDAPMIAPCQKTGILWTGVPPMSQLFSAGEAGLFQLKRSWKSPEWFELTALAANRKEPVLFERGSGSDTLLMVAYPGQDFADWVFAGEIALGEKWKKLAVDLHHQRLLLVLILLFAMLLAHRVATRFLEPAAALVEAADRIRGGDYSARLHLDRTDEFGVLGDAFNRMARSAEEGRLLGRFVPATARALAADDEASRAARSGESRQVIVLFAGLAGFKKRLTTCEPGPLILWLNRHLETMSRVIRAHGGETNKFIGDKILAVFTPAPGQSLSSVIPAALAAARGMHQAFPALRETAAETGPGPEPQLGIGLVAGPVLAGILGTESVRLEFTVIGDTVNLASRLSDLASNQDGGAVLVERELVQNITGDEASVQGFRKLETTTVKGKTRAIEIWQFLE